MSGEASTPSSSPSPSPAILNIPKVNAPPSGNASSCASPPSTTATSSVQEFNDVNEDEAIGEFDDGKSGKLTLSTLLQEGLIEAGEGVLSIEYLGQTFKGDLLGVGKIRSQETGLVFNNPSAWAIYCKKIVNPSKKSGCGWASVKYKGRKMDHFKTQWTKMKSQRDAEEAEKKAALEEEEERIKIEELEKEGLLRKAYILKHSQLGTKGPDDALDTLVDVETFPRQGKVQPFTLSCSSSALLLLDLHAHLSKTAVTGYLAGHWDVNTHNLAITHTFPCLVGADDGRDDLAKIEYDIYNAIYGRHLALVGWYRSNPENPRALPTLRDSEAQLDHQVRMLGNSDASYSPCVGMITQPYTSGCNESDHVFYWVVPPAETQPNDYGRPMKMTYTKVADPCLAQELLEQIETTIRHYNAEDDLRMDFMKKFNSDTTFLTKMGRSILPKFPSDQNERLWRYMKLLILGTKHQDMDDPLISQYALVAANGNMNGYPNHGLQHHEEDQEEEIDDDEENALQRVRGSGGAGNRRTASRADSSSSNARSNSIMSDFQKQFRQFQQSISAQSVATLTPIPASSSASTTAGAVAQPPPPSNDEVISMLLKQSPLAPAAHGGGVANNAGSRSGLGPSSTAAPLDFSSTSNGVAHDDEEEEEEIDDDEENGQ